LGDRKVENGEHCRKIEAGKRKPGCGTGSTGHHLLGLGAAESSRMILFETGGQKKGPISSGWETGNLSSNVPSDWGQ